MRRSHSTARAASRACGAALCIGSLLVLLCSCGSSAPASNGLASQAPTRILESAQAAAYAATSAHVSGSLTSDGAKITLDLDLLAGKGGRGQLAENGLSFELIETGGYVYIKGSPAFYAHIAGPATAQLFLGKWLQAPAGSGNFASLASLTNLHSLIETTLAGHGSLGKGAPTNVDGQDVITLSDASQGGRSMWPAGASRSRLRSSSREAAAERSSSTTGMSRSRSPHPPTPSTSPSSDPAGEPGAGGPRRPL